MIYNEEFFLLHSELCKTISNPKRQAILFSLKEKELNVRELVDKTGISQSTISQHLAILKDKGIVQVRKQGSNSYYSISNPKIMKAYDLMSEVLEEVIELKTRTIKRASSKK
ncbi:MAG TPA: transcriptional regulator [Actinobacteria bacterium]|nr:transcriptional regulator [Actinomycetota bacterium]